MVVPELLSWIICVDGFSNISWAGAGVLVYIPKGGRIEQCIQFRFQATNNEAEYEAVIVGLKIAEILCLFTFEQISDSKIVIDLKMEAHEPNMKFFSKIREENLSADGLASSLPECEPWKVQIEVLGV